MGGLGIFAVIHEDSADDHAVFMDDWEVRASTVGAEESILLMHGVRPLDLTGLAVEALKQTTDTKSEDITGLAITDDTRPSHAFHGDIRQVNTEPGFPQNLTGLGIQADDLFTFFARNIFLVSSREVEPVVQQDWRRTTVGRCLPQDVSGIALCSGVPAVRKVGFRRDPIHIGTTPKGPVRSRGQGRRQCSAQQTQD